MLTKAPYDSLCAGFRWNLPGRLNMAAQVCDDWPARAPEQVAIVDLSNGRDKTAYAQHMLIGHPPMTVTGKVIRKELKARAAAEGTS